LLSFLTQQDELAETQVPSPGYTGVYDEIAMEGFEYDVYEYFGELEYGSDSYWDARMKHLEAVGLGEKRKSADQENEDTEARAVKKRRKDGGRGVVQEVGDNVLYVPFERRLAPLPPGIEQQGGDGRFALLPDWKERFPERLESPVGKRKPMPAEMRKAAAEVGGDEDVEEEDEEMSGEREDGDEMEMGEDGEPEEDDEDGDEEEEEEEQSAVGLDQDLVMQVLRQKLADSGLGDVDESMFKDVIAKMMSGDGDSEDAVGGLASLLLGQEGGGGKAFEGFLAGQGVELGGAEGDDDDDESESKDDDTETDPRPTKKAKANPTRKTSQRPSSTASSSTANPKPTTKTSSKSRTTRSNLSQTTTFQQSPSPNRTSPIVVPSPPPPATAVASSTRPSRKRRAPSLDEPALPEPPQVATATASSSAKPPAKRRRATPTSSRSQTPADDSGTATTRRRTTRSAAAGARKGGD
jgi:hypothetical protein